MDLSYEYKDNKRKEPDQKNEPTVIASYNLLNDEAELIDIIEIGEDQGWLIRSYCDGPIFLRQGKTVDDYLICRRATDNTTTFKLELKPAGQYIGQDVEDMLRQHEGQRATFWPDEASGGICWRGPPVFLIYNTFGHRVETFVDFGRALWSMNDDSISLAPVRTALDCVKTRVQHTGEFYVQL